MNKYLEKSAILSELAGLAGFHLGSNALVRTLLRSKKAGKRIADSFAQGTRGIIDGSAYRRAGSTLQSMVAPEMEILYHQASELGRKLQDHLPSTHPRVQAGLRMLSKGQFNRYDRLKKHMGMSPSIEAAIDHYADAAGTIHGIPFRKIMDAPPHIKSQIEEIWHDPNHPLLSNVLSRISKGSIHASREIKGKLNEYAPLAAQALTAGIDQVGAGLNALKTMTLIDKVKRVPYLGAGIDRVEDYFTKHQAEIGRAHPGFNKYLYGAKNRLMEFGANAASASIKNTSATLHHILGGE